MRYHGHTMDIERTMQFILDHQARHEIEIADIRRTMAENHAKMAENHARADSEMAAIRQTLAETTKVQLEQARILVQIEEGHKELAAAQKVTEQKLQNFIDSLGRSTNGH